MKPSIKQPMKLLSLSILATLILSVLPACGEDAKPVQKAYISQDGATCSKILFTCPQFQEIFMDDSGCGCVSSTKADDPEAGSLGNLLKEFLKTKVLGFDASKDKAFLDYISLKATSKYSADGKTSDLRYELWTDIQKYEVQGTDMKKVVEFTGPIILNLTETGQNYIVNSFEKYDMTDTKNIEAKFSAESVAWIFDKSKDPSVAVKDALKGRVDSDASAYGELIKGLAK